MDAATFLTALTELFSVGGIPLAVLGLVAWSWLQDRRKQTPSDDLAAFVRSTNDRLARIEARLEILWKG